MINEHLDVLNAQLDETALQKRLSIEAEHLKRIKCTKTLRIYTDPTRNYMKINTRVINDCNTECKTKIWDLVKRVVVSTNTNIPSIDDELIKEGIQVNENVEPENIYDMPVGTGQKEQPDNHESINKQDTEYETFEWDSSSNSEGFGLPIDPKYKKMQLLIKLKNPRGVYKLSKPVRDLFGKYSSTLQNVVKDFYKYVNTHHLNEYSSGKVECNEVLESIFGVKSFYFGDIEGLIHRHLEPIGYCVINLSLERKEIWDIQMEMDDLAHMPTLYPKNVHEMEKKIEATLEVKKRLDAQIETLEEFVRCPVLFVNRKIALESEGLGAQTAFYDNLGVQTAVYELIKKYEASNATKKESQEADLG